MKHSFAFLWMAGVLSLLMVGTPALAVTVLVDYVDDDPNNGLHDASVGNGGLEDTNEASGRGLVHRSSAPNNSGTIPGYFYSWFQDTLAGGNSVDGPYLWNSAGFDADNNRTAISGWGSINDLPRRHLGILPPTSVWSIADGDTFHFEFLAREGSGMDNDDYVDVEVFAVDYTDPNNLAFTEIGGNDLRLDTPDDGAWAAFAHILTIDFAAMGNLLGQGIAYRLFLNTDGSEANRNEFTILDNFYLTAEASGSVVIAPELSSSLLCVCGVAWAVCVRRRNR